MKKIILLCYILAVLVRIYSVFPFNTIIGFDQARDLFDAYTMTQTHHLRVIGPTAGNNPNLHHGIAFIYYLSVPISLFGANPMNAVYFNILIQSGVVIVLALLSWELFHKKEAMIATSLLASFSYYLTQFAGWLSNPTATIVTVALFYYSLWKFKEQKKYILLTAVSLGLSIQFELFFIYLIPVILIYIALFRPKFPGIKLILASFFLFLLTTSTMIATEFKYSFKGVESILFAGQAVGGSLPFWDRVHFFSTRLSDQFSLSVAPAIPSFLALLFCIILYSKISDKKEKEGLKFLYLYLSSPLLMLFLGAHSAPWFLIALPPAIVLLYGYIFSKIRLLGAIILIFICCTSFYRTTTQTRSGQAVLEPDRAAILSRQVEAIKYTYYKSHNEAFSIDTVTNPLYINAVWGYHYMWLGKNNHYLPSFIGGDQLPPYNTLKKPNGNEKYLYVIVDTTPRIPAQYTQNALANAERLHRLIEKESFNGIDVYKYEVKK